MGHISRNVCYYHYTLSKIPEARIHSLELLSGLYKHNGQIIKYKNSTQHTEEAGTIRETNRISDRLCRTFIYQSGGDAAHTGKHGRQAGSMCVYTVGGTNLKRRLFSRY